MTKQTRWTRGLREGFLTAMRNNGGNVSDAAQKCAMSRMSCYQERQRSATFAARWQEIVDGYTDAMEAEAFRRAVQGVTEPVFHAGEMCGAVQKYSDTLLKFLLESRDPDRFRAKGQTARATIATGKAGEEVVFTLDLGQGREITDDDDDPI
jgi:hypothetical protein